MRPFHTVREWESLRVADEENAIARTTADELCSLAEKAQAGLGLGGETSERILENRTSSIRAQQVVGVIAGTNTSLEILPKIDGLEGNDGATRTNLVRMLARTYDLPIADGALSQLGTQEHDLLEILIRLFVAKLFPAVHRGLPRRYVNCQDDLPTLRGSLDVVRQFSTLAAAPHKLASKFDELSPDIPLNQLMKAAVLRLRSIARTTDNQRRLAELALAFADVRDVQPGSPDFDAVVLDRTNSEWHELVRMAKLLLRGDYQTTSKGHQAGFSLLFEMNVLFEEFVGRCFQQQIRTPGARVTLQGPQLHVLMDKDTGVRRFRTRPDIVLHEQGRAQVIVDTKWKRLKGDIEDPKRGVGQADIYQMLAYGDVYDASELILLYPHHAGLGDQPGIIAEYSALGASNRTLKIATVSLEKVETVGAQLQALVNGCCKPIRAVA